MNLIISRTMHQNELGADAKCGGYVLLTNMADHKNFDFYQFFRCFSGKGIPGFLPTQSHLHYDADDFGQFAGDAGVDEASTSRLPEDNLSISSGNGGAFQLAVSQPVLESSQQQASSFGSCHPCSRSL